MLMSPYVPAGAVFQEPQGPYPDSQFDLSSVVATAKHLFGVPGFLTRRDAWAGSFHELLTLTTPRTDAPMHLPDGPPIHAERERERRRLQQLEEEMGSEEAAAAATDGGEQSPRHCSSSAAAAAASTTDGGECAADGDSVTQKQRNRIKVFSAMTNSLAPSEAELAAMTKDEAAQWQHERWAEWVGHGLGWRQQQNEQAYVVER
eukprot:COSAG06_NODE_5858_length_3243_cov_4.755407_2_plen_204_part_00